jgi:hypothetical protein
VGWGEREAEKGKTTGRKGKGIKRNKKGEGQTRDRATRKKVHEGRDWEGRRIGERSSKKVEQSVQKRRGWR